MEELFAKRIKLEKRKLQAYLDISGVLMVTLDKNGDIMLVNKKLLEVLGYKQEELIGRNWFETCIPPSSRDVIYQTFKRLVQGVLGPHEFYINPVLTKAGNERIVTWHNSIVKDEENTVVAVLGSGEDITDFKTAEKYYHDLFEEAPLAYFSIDKDDSIQNCNKAAEYLLGYSRNEFLTMKFLDLLENPKLGLAPEKKAFDKILDGYQILESKLQLKKKTGKISGFDYQLIIL